MMVLLSCEYDGNNPKTYSGISVELPGLGIKEAFKGESIPADYLAASAFAHLAAPDGFTLVVSPTMELFMRDGGDAILPDGLPSAEQMEKASMVARDRAYNIAKERSGSVPFPVGHRIVALSHSDDKCVYIYGYGFFVGTEIPPPETYVDGHDMSQLKLPLGKFLLDNGTVVWSFQCAIGPIEGFQEELVKGRDVIEIAFPYIPERPFAN